MSDSDNDDMDNKFDKDSDSDEDEPKSMKQSMIEESQNNNKIEMTMNKDQEMNSSINKPKKRKSFKESKDNDLSKVLDNFQENMNKIPKSVNNENQFYKAKKETRNDISKDEANENKNNQERENKGFGQNQDEQKGFGGGINRNNNNDRDFEGAREFQGFRRDDNRSNEQGFQGEREFQGFGRNNDRGFSRGYNNHNNNHFGEGERYRGNNNFRGDEETRGFSNRNNNKDFGGEREFRGFGGGGFNRNNDRDFNRDYRGNGGGRFNNGRRWGNNRRFSNNRGGNFRNYNNNNNTDSNNTGSHFYSNNATRATPLEKDPFYISHKSLILDIKDIYTGLVEKDIIQILKIITLNSSRTIFEIMNEITRQNKIMLTLKEKEKSVKREYDERMEITELPYSKDAVSEFEQIIKDYKVYSENDDKELQKEFYYTSEKDRRRPLKKDTNGHYNYVPTYSPYSPSLREQISIDDIYAKNINEINYHSLTYKTIVCRKAVCNDNYCPNAHGMEENFRIIYDYKDDKICQLMRKLMNTTSLRIESYLEHFEIPKKFSLLNFKIHKCPLNPQCNYDRHLCMMYHSEEEKRRPPKLFRYENESCRYAQDSKNSPFKPELCPFGIFCSKIHSVTEFNYHKSNFQKIFKCNREKVNNRCIFYQTCYGIHNNSDDEENDIDEDEEDEDEDKDKAKEKEKSKKQEKKNYEKLFKEKEELLNKFICPKCKTLPPKQTYCMLNECKHVVCKNCFKSSRKEKGAAPQCPICGLEIQKGGAILIKFQQNEN